MNRREVIKSGLVTVGAVATCAFTDVAVAWMPRAKLFRLDYAPHFRMFQHSAGGDLSD